MSFSWDSILNLSNESLPVFIVLALGFIILQVYNHLPSQIKDLKKELKDDQKEMRKELRDDIKALDQKIDQTNQKIEQNYKDITTQNNQNFKELASLITKQRTGS